MTKPQFSKRLCSAELAGHGALMGVCLLAAAFGDGGRAALRYERVGLLDGQWWRVVTGHLVHLGGVHTLLNLAGFALLIWLFQAEIRRWAWLTVGLAAAAAIALGLFLFSPQTQWYVGLSGVLHGWFAFGTARTLHSDLRFGLLLLVALLVKLGWEQFSGPMPFTTGLNIGPVVVDAHLYGALGGGLCYVAWRGRKLVAASERPL